MILQERDINILKSVFRYKYLNTDQIHKLFFDGKSRTAMYHVLKRLSVLNLVNQVTLPRTPNLSMGNILYITRRGALVIADESRSTLEEIGFRKIIKPISSINHYYHRKKEIDFLIKLDEELLSLPLKLKAFATDGERERRNKKQVVKTHISTTDEEYTLVPDVYFVLQSELNPEKEKLFFVEIDTGKETIGGKDLYVSPSSLMHKYISYEKILVDGKWKDNMNTSAEVFEVLTVTEKDSHIQGIKNKAGNFIKWKHLFLFTTHSSVEKDGVLVNKNWTSLKMENKMQKLV
ncbi:MAG: hypothetical protein DWQ06_13740 [Calditrichaeota bacterium]|nr:MAG: hypothetical protein DWQ06_13740 [Calditrichota bacterium]